MFRPLILLTILMLALVPETLLAQKEGQVTQVRRTRDGQAESVEGEPVRTATEVRLLEENGAAALLADLGEGFLAEDAQALSGHVAATSIPFALDPAEGSADPSRAPLRSSEQIYYLLRDWFERVTVEEVECDCPEEDLGVEDAHGVLELGLEDASRSRLFVRLRRAEDAWRLVELRALP